MAYTVVTHSKALEFAIKRCPLVSECVLVPNLLLDINTYGEGNFGFDSKLNPILVKSKSYPSIKRKLSPLVGKPNVLVAYEPRHDAASWAQQVGGLLGFPKEGKNYIPLFSLHEDDLRSAILTPERIPSFYPAEWIYMRMIESAVASNINACIVDAGMDKSLPPQNLYSMFLLHKIATMALTQCEAKYCAVLLDTYTGLPLGQEVEPPKNGVFTAAPLYSASEERLNRTLKTCSPDKFEKVSEITGSFAVPEGPYPITSGVFGQLLRKRTNNIDSVFNGIYGLYCKGALTFPFSKVSLSPEAISKKLAPSFKSIGLRISEKTLKHAQYTNLHTVSVLPNAWNSEIEGREAAIRTFVEMLAVNSLREKLACRSTKSFYRCKDRYFAAESVSFFNTSKETAAMLSVLYPDRVDVKRIGIYKGIIRSQNRIPLHTALSFTARSPNWLKWFIAFHYLLEQNLLALDGEDIVLSDTTIECMPDIDNIFGPLFKDPQFIAFDAIFNDVEKQKRLFYYIVSRLPETKGNERDLER